MPIFDVHVVAQEIGGPTELALLALGFTNDLVLGGDPRVVMRRLLSKKSESASAADGLYDQAVQLLSADQTFVGYIESEATTSRDHVDAEAGKEASALKHVPMTPCPTGRLKRCDIHASGLHVTNEVRSALLDAGLYYLVLDKPGRGAVTVFTIQTEALNEGQRLHQVLLEFLRGSGGFVGTVKFEVLRRLQNFGAQLPPLVLVETGIQH